MVIAFNKLFAQLLFWLYELLDTIFEMFAVLCGIETLETVDADAPRSLISVNSYCLGIRSRRFDDRGNRQKHNQYERRRKKISCKDGRTGVWINYRYSLYGACYDCRHIHVQYRVAKSICRNVARR